MSGLEIADECYDLIRSQVLVQILAALNTPGMALVLNGSIVS